MNKKQFNQQKAFVFKKFSRKGYALFSCIGKLVLIGTLSVPTLAYAKADGISVKGATADSIRHREQMLDEVEITGTLSPLSPTQSARMVTVLTRTEVERAAVASVNDLLKLASGVDVRQRGGFGVQTDISVNGGTFDQVALLLNGVNISSPHTGHNAFLLPVPLSAIERIEIIEGASSRVHGASAFSGAINIVTRSVWDNSVQLDLSGGSFGTFDASGCAQLATSQSGHLIGLGYARSDGGTLHSDFHKRNFYYSGDYCSSRVHLRWQAGLFNQHYGANTFYSARYDNQYETLARKQASVDAIIPLLPHSRLVMRTRLYGQDDLDHYQLTRGMVGSAAGENYHDTRAYGASTFLTAQWQAGATTLGADVRKEHILSTGLGELMPQEEWKDISGSEQCYNRVGQRTNTSLYLEHNLVLRSLTLSAGVIANRNTQVHQRFHFYPGLDLCWRPSMSWSVFASCNLSLRVPTFSDLYQNNAVQQGSTSLFPERNLLFKTGATYSRKAFTATLSAYHSRGRNMIDWVFPTSESQRYKALNIGRINAVGVTTDLTYRFDHNNSKSLLTMLRLGYTYHHQTYSTDEPVFRSLYALEYLRHKVTCSLAHRIVGRLSAQWQFRWQQRMNGYHPYAKVDCKVLYPTRHYELFLLADNLTNHRYYDLGSIPQPGLWVMAGAKWKLGK